jgi:aminoglycoside 3-N-acetyltransferase I
VSGPHGHEGDHVTVERLGPSQRAAARALFALMAEVFEEPHEALSDAYLDRLLGRPDFWALGARVGGELAGGLTAHTLPMTTSEWAEVFLYDIAVRPDHQRRGLGRRLVAELCRRARDAGIATMFVAADDEDAHALDFYRAIEATGSPVTMFVLDT